MSEQKILMSVSDVTPEDILFLVNARKGSTGNQVNQFLSL